MNDNRGWMEPKFPDIYLTVEENPEKPNQENWPDRGSNPSPLGERQHVTLRPQLWSIVWKLILRLISSVHSLWQTRHTFTFNFAKLWNHVITFIHHSTYRYIRPFCGIVVRTLHYHCGFSVLLFTPYGIHGERIGVGAGFSRGSPVVLCHKVHSTGFSIINSFILANHPLLWRCIRSSQPVPLSITDLYQWTSPHFILGPDTSIS